jgi:hypothetical protein
MLANRGSQPGARGQHGTLLISDSALQPIQYTKSGSSSIHFMPVLVDGKRLRAPAC